MGHWGDQFASNPGDPALLMWQMRLQSHAAGAGDLGSLMQANIFFDHRDVIAYSDNLIALLPAFAPVLRLTGDNPIAAYNAVALVGYAASSIAVFLLARHLLAARLPALLAAVVFAAAPYHTVALDHVQLVGIAFVPLAILALVRLCAQPRSWWWGALAGACAGLAWLTSLYCAVMLAIALPLAVVVWAAQRRMRVDRRILVGLGLGVAVCGVLVAPTLPAYLRVQSTGANSRGVDELLTASSANFRHLPPSGLWTVLGHGSPVTAEANTLFPGIVALSLGAAGAAVLGAALLRRPPWRRETEGRGGAEDEAARLRREWALPLSAVFVACLAVLAGPQRSGPAGWPDRVLRAVLPGMGDLRDLVRFWLVALVVLGLAAGVGGLWLCSRLGDRWGPLVVALLIGLCLGENLYRLPFSSIALAPPATDADQALASMPRGPVVELPLEPVLSAEYDLSVAPRQVRSVVDGDPRLEGYSGNLPGDTRAAVEVARTLPDAGALVTLRRIGVRYLVLHGGPTDCWGEYGPGELNEIVTELTGQAGVETVESVGSDRIVVLAPAQPALALADVVGPPHAAPPRPVPQCPSS